MSLFSAILKRGAKSGCHTKLQGTPEISELPPEEVAPFCERTGKYDLRFRLIRMLILITGISSFQHIPLSQKIKVQPTGAPNLILRFKATVHGQPLRLHQNYTNPFGETFRPDIFRFYAGKIRPALKNDPAKKEYSEETYHLIDFADAASTTVRLRVSEGVYDEIRFLLGVDSIDQTGGAQGGALDPARGMFWTWNTGYLSLKIEGTSPDSREPFHAFSYHIGGYRFPNRAISDIRIGTDNGQKFRVGKKNITDLTIFIELDDFFDGAIPLHIRNTPACTTPGDTAVRILQNFAEAFTGIQTPGSP
jgi:hypothetical protein